MENFQLKVFINMDATLNNSSIHYNDQSVLFSNLKMKPSFIYFDQLKPYIKNPIILRFIVKYYYN